MLYEVLQVDLGCVLVGGRGWVTVGFIGLRVSAGIVLEVLLLGG